MGLTPKQSIDGSKYGWDRLDQQLKASIIREHDTLTIRISDFDIPAQEIIAEAEKNGYNVTKSQDGQFLYFE